MSITIYRSSGKPAVPPPSKKWKYAPRFALLALNLGVLVYLVYRSV